MAKITLNDVGSLIDATTAATTINSNTAAIETAFDNTLSRDGAGPNSMSADLDMNSNQIVNLPAPSNANSPLRLQDLASFSTGGIPAGGTTGQALKKNSNTSYDTSWGNTLSTITSPNNTLSLATVSGAVSADINPNTSNTWTAVQTFNAPVLGTPTSATLTNATGLPISTGISGLAAGAATFLGTPSSANLKTAVTDETGSGALVFATSPALITPTGIVKGDVGLGNVDNTSDVTKNAAAVTLTNKTISGASNTLSNIALSSLATQAAYTLVGNNTGSAASPTAVDIATVTSKASPAASDLILISDQAASGAWKRATVSSVSAAGSVASIAGNTGAFTLSNGITNSTNDIRLAVIASGTMLANATGSSAIPTATAVPVLQKQVITTTGAGTWTSPAGTLSTTVFKFTLVGGGGGGGAATGVPAGAGGGGAGGTCIVWLSGLAASTAYTTNIGVGGTAGAGSGVSGGNGGNTTILINATTYTAAGGTGAGSSTAANTSGDGGAGGTATNGTINITGGDGSGSLYNTAQSSGMGGTGGASSLGGGGRGAYGGGIAGSNANAYGAGGGGSCISATGGTGKQGILIVEWTL